MPTETTVTRCGNCGAALDRRPGQSELACAYCRQSTFLAPTVTAAAPATDDGGSVHQRLLRGPSGASHGAGARYAPAQMAGRDVNAPERGLWPVGARASSTFGGAWSPSALLGPPRIYPRCGDIGGAWAPGPSRSPVEWVEVDFGADVPAAAVRVFETNRPGSTFAVVDATDGDALLYEAPPRADGQAQVLEVAVQPPRVVRRLRVYVVNPGWAELDTVGLLAAGPLPEALRTRPPPPPRSARPLAWIVGLGALAVVAALAAVGAGVRSGRAARPRPAAAIGGATLRYEAPAPEAFAVRGVEWADDVEGFSSEFSPTLNSAQTVRGAPDVYPRYGDLAGAWASRTTDEGEEWIEVSFAAPVTTTQVLWVETFNPGAVSRVDDLSDPSAPVVLWEGAASPRPTSAVVAALTLPAPRAIRALRLVLDSRRVPGWNELDAVGLARSP